MTKTTGLTAPLSAAAGSRTEPAQVITPRLAAAGLAVHATRQQDQHELVILNIPDALSCLTLTGTGCAQWHYEPATGPATDAATLTAIIEHILGAPQVADTAPDADAYRSFPLKGTVGRCLQDRGLTVTCTCARTWNHSRPPPTSRSPARPARGSASCGSAMTAIWNGTATTAPPSTATPAH